MGRFETVGSQNKRTLEKIYWSRKFLVYIQIHTALVRYSSGPNMSARKRYYLNYIQKSWFKMVCPFEK
jgi:hypothetical protein